MNKNRWKRLLSLMLALTMILSWNVPAYASEPGTTPQEGQCEEGQHEKPADAETTPATCKTPEKWSGTCAKEGCGAVVKDQVVADGELDPTNHEWGEAYRVEPNCKENAKMVQACTNEACKELPDAIRVVKDLWEDVPEAERDPEDKAGEHNFVFLKYLKEPTCARAGVATYKCTGCGNQTTRVAPAGHDYPQDEVEDDASFITTVEPTCQKPGTKTYTCKRYVAPDDVTEENPNKCDKEDGRTRTEEIPKKDHTKVEDKNVPATCGQEGKVTYKCSACGIPLPDQTVTTPATGSHTYQPGQIIASEKCGVAPKVGQVCSTCGAVHPDGAVDMTPEQIESRLDEEGLIKGDGDKILYSKECKFEEKDGTVHATCTEDGLLVLECKYCHEKKTETEPAGHAFKTEPGSDGKTHTLYTQVVEDCTEGGHYTKECAREDCGAVVTVTDEKELASAIELKGELTAPTAHKAEELEAKDPTCTNPGNTAGKRCSACEKILEGSILEPVAGNHVLDENDKTVTRPATCTTPGMESGVCTECKKKVYMIIPAEHAWAEVTPIKPATCTEPGKMASVCTKCGTTDDNIVIKALGHDFAGTEEDTLIEDKKPTCTATGKKVVKCSRCEEEQETIIDATGHDFLSNADQAQGTEPTCGTIGEKVITCANEGCTEKQTTVLPATGKHEAKDGVEFISATCKHGTQIGVTCQNCGEAVTKEGATAPVMMEFPVGTTLQQVIDFYKANPDETHYSLIATEGKVTDSDIEKLYKEWQKDASDKKGHSWIETVTQPATCEVPGKKDQVCKYNCGTENHDVEMEALGHQWEISEKGEDIKFPSCDGTKGTMKMICKKCSAEKQEEMDIPIPDHVEVKKVIREASCTVTGLTTYECSECKKVIRSEVVPAGHKWAEPAFVVPESSKLTEEDKKQELKKATCTEAGKGYFVCEREVDDDGTKCGEEKIDTIEALNHGTWSKVGLIEATCTTPAMVGRTCGNPGEEADTTCGAIDTETAVEITADSDVNALLEQILADMDNVTADSTAEILAKLNAAKANPGPTGHDYNAEASETIEPGCVTEGMEIYTCKNNCGIDLKEKIPAKGHVEEDDYIPATCQSAGKMRTICGVCKKQLTQPVELENDPILPHDFKRTETPATTGGKICVVGGTFRQICTMCHKEETGLIDPGHSLVSDMVYDTAETTKLIAIVMVCGRGDCSDNTGDTKKIQEVKWTADGYAYCEDCAEVVKVTITGNIPATCTQVGNTGTVTCTKVTTHVIQAGEKLEKLPHDTKDQVEKWDVHTPATCNKTGIKVKYCSKCTERDDKGNVTTPGEIIDEDTIPVSGEHTLKAEIQPATCQHGERYANFCTGCGMVESVITEMDPELGDHNYGIDETDKDTYGVCTNPKDDGTPCGEHVPEGWKFCETEHKWAATKTLEAQTATCQQEGWTEREVCVNFGEKNGCTTVYSGTKTGEKLTHEEADYTDREIKAPTCGEKGQKQKYCPCGLPFGEPIDVAATGNHKAYHWVTKPATCKDPETDVYECTECGTATTDSAYAPIEHGKADPSLHKMNAENTACTVCSKTAAEIKTQIGKSCTTHADAGIKPIPGKEATCIEPGLTQGFQCAADGCNVILLPQEIVPVTDHKFGEDGTCDNCGVKNISVATSAVGQVVDGNDKLTFRVTTEIADRDKVVEMGILYITKSGYTGTVEDAKADLTVLESEMHDNTFTLAGREFARAKQYNINENANLGNYTQASVTFNFGAGTNRSRQVYARGYVIMENADGGYEIHYAEEILTGTVGSFF